MKLLVMNGPNLNFLGIREPDKYGTQTYEGLLKLIRAHCDAIGVEVSFYQSNHEGDLVDAFQKAYYDKIDAIVINPGAYTHTSIALLDAARSVQIPLAEVHITDIATREPFRRISYIREAAKYSVVGHGINGYLEAVDLLVADYRNA